VADVRTGGLVRAGLAGAALLGVALAPAAVGSGAGTFTQSTAPAAGGASLVIRVGVSGTAPEPLFVSVVYYRGASGQCAPTPQQQAGTQILDQEPVAAGPYALRRDSAPVPKGLWTVCGYLFRGTPPDNLFFVDGSADIVGTDVTGGGSSGGAAPTAVVLAAARQGSRYHFAGRTNGAPTGTVRVQRRSGATWRTIATAAVRKGRWSVLAAARKGQTVRALLLVKGKQSSRSAPKRLS
jgi:hypothetical protein